MDRPLSLKQTFAWVVNHLPLLAKANRLLKFGAQVRESQAHLTPKLLLYMPSLPASIVSHGFKSSPRRRGMGPVPDSSSLLSFRSWTSDINDYQLVDGGSITMVCPKIDIPSLLSSTWVSPEFGYSCYNTSIRRIHLYCSTASSLQLQSRSSTSDWITRASPQQPSTTWDFPDFWRSNSYDVPCINRTLVRCVIENSNLTPESLEAMATEKKDRRGFTATNSSVSVKTGKWSSRFRCYQSYRRRFDSVEFQLCHC
jgi:hypothetical protein